MDTVPQTVNCVDVLPRTSRHLHSHLLWTTLEPGHCHCAVCLMEPHMNISMPSVNKSNTGVRTLISHHKRRTLVTLKILFFVEQENAWDFHCAEWERETYRKCVRETWQVCCLASSAPIKNMTGAKKNSNIVTLTTHTWGKLVITRLI